MLRDSEAASRREDVRSRRRVWYANGPDGPGDLESFEEFEVGGFGRSIRVYVMLVVTEKEARAVVDRTERT